MEAVKEAIVVAAAIVVLVVGALIIKDHIHTGCFFGKCATVITH